MRLNHFVGLTADNAGLVAKADRNGPEGAKQTRGVEQEGVSR